MLVEDELLDERVVGGRVEVDEVGHERRELVRGRKEGERNGEQLPAEQHALVPLRRVVVRYLLDNLEEELVAQCRSVAPALLDDLQTDEIPLVVRLRLLLLLVFTVTVIVVAVAVAVAVAVVCVGEEGGKGEVGALEEHGPQLQVGDVLAQIAHHLAIAHIDLHELEELARLLLEQLAVRLDQRLLYGLAAPCEQVARIAVVVGSCGCARVGGGRGGRGAALLVARYEEEKVVVRMRGAASRVIDVLLVGRVLVGHKHHIVVIVVIGSAGSSSSSSCDTHAIRILPIRRAHSLVVARERDGQVEHFVDRLTRRDDVMVTIRIMMILMMQTTLGDCLVAVAVAVRGVGDDHTWLLLLLLR